MRVYFGWDANIVRAHIVGHNFRMHGQKKRRKRTIEGSMAVDGASLIWELLSEPQWSNSGDGYIGMCIGVRFADAAR